MLLPRTVIPRGGISVTEDEDYKCISSTIKVMACRIRNSYQFIEERSIWKKKD